MYGYVTWSYNWKIKSLTIVPIFDSIILFVLNSKSNLKSNHIE